MFLTSYLADWSFFSRRGQHLTNAHQVNNNNVCDVLSIASLQSGKHQSDCNQNCQRPPKKKHHTTDGIWPSHGWKSQVSLPQDGRRRDNVRCRMTDDFQGTDPFRIFAVDTEEPCRILTVAVRSQEQNIGKGWVGDPDLSLVFRIPGTPNGKKRIKCGDRTNSSLPQNNGTLKFVLGPQRNSTALLEASLLMTKYTGEKLVATKEVKLDDLAVGEEREVTLAFGEVAKVVLVLNIYIDTESDLRFSQYLCAEEIEYLAKRRLVVKKHLAMVLGKELNLSDQEVPVIGVMGSGGGFRAMTGLSGAFKALFNSGFLDCVTYVAGLSGSSWYLSSLYSHPDFLPKTPGELEGEIKENISHSPFWLMAPHSLYRYFGSIRAKTRQGQPVSFTDFFGHLLGDTLLKGRTDVRLTDHRAKIADGQLPFPLYTCVHVKGNVSAQVFQEWIEFTPYEVGVAKYGTFMKTEKFGSKYYRGKVVRHHPEYPLHFFMGIWGSAFCILFKRFMDERIKLPIPLLSTSRMDEETVDDDVPKMHQDNLEREEEKFREQSGTINTDEMQCNAYNMHKSDSEEEVDMDHGLGSKSSSPLGSPKHHDGKLISNQNGFWQRFVDGICTSPFLDTRKGRAGVVLNPFRGLSFVPLHPSLPHPMTTPEDDEPFKGLFEVGPVDAKRLYVVDGGLTFNLPFPLLLRPQRELDLLVTFDFSARDKDGSMPFKELLIAENWARLNNCPFPPVRERIAELKTKPIQEYYIFRHPTDLQCPIILYFPLVNKDFRKYKTPGHLRETPEEIQFADFDIFSDPNTPYSLFNFKYTHLQFERLNKLMEFNVLNNLDVIKATYAEAIERRRERLRNMKSSSSSSSHLLSFQGDIR